MTDRCLVWIVLTCAICFPLQAAEAPKAKDVVGYHLRGEIEFRGMIGTSLAMWNQGISSTRHTVASSTPTVEAWHFPGSVVCSVAAGNFKNTWVFRQRPGTDGDFRFQIWSSSRSLLFNVPDNEVMPQDAEWITPGWYLRRYSELHAAAVPAARVDPLNADCACETLFAPVENDARRHTTGQFRYQYAICQDRISSGVCYYDYSVIPASGPDAVHYDREGTTQSVEARTFSCGDFLKDLPFLAGTFSSNQKVKAGLNTIRITAVDALGPDESENEVVRRETAGLQRRFCQSAWRGGTFKDAPVVPPVMMQNLDGSMQDIAQLARDKITLLYFWASWASDICYNAGSSPPGNYHVLPRIAKLAERHAGENDFEIIGVSLDANIQAARANAARCAMTWRNFTLASDTRTSLTKLLGVQELPWVVAVDEHGRVVPQDSEVESLLGRDEALNSTYPDELRAAGIERIIDEFRAANASGGYMRATLGAEGVKALEHPESIRVFELPLSDERMVEPQADTLSTRGLSQEMFDGHPVVRELPTPSPEAGRRLCNLLLNDTNFDRKDVSEQSLSGPLGLEIRGAETTVSATLGFEMRVEVESAGTDRRGTRSGWSKEGAGEVKRLTKQLLGDRP